MSSTIEIKRCIYCRREYLHARQRAQSHFSAEHVIHQGLTAGVGGSNLTLLGLVCKRCNGFLGQNLDQNFLRSGYIGMLRFEAGQKDAMRYHEFNVQSLPLRAYKGDEQTVHGVPIKRVIRQGKLVSEFVYVCAIELSNGIHYLTEIDIDNGKVPKLGTEDVDDDLKALIFAAERNTREGTTTRKTGPEWNELAPCSSYWGFRRFNDTERLCTEAAMQSVTTSRMTSELWASIFNYIQKYFYKGPILEANVGRRSKRQFIRKIAWMVRAQSFQVFLSCDSTYRLARSH
jgi:hypothetical protein